MLDQGLSPRKVFAWFVIALVALFALIWLYKYLTTGQVVVTTDNPKSFVKIDGILGEKSGGFSKQAQHKISVRVRPGRYEVSAYDEHGADASSRLVTVKARQKLSFNINPSKIVGAVPVYGKEVVGVVADSSQLLFIDKASGNLEVVDSAGNLTTLSSGGFTNAAWVNPSLGVAQASDNTLYLVKNGTVSPLQLPFKVTDGQSVSYDISKDGQIYLAFGNNVYSGRNGGIFKKIYSVSGSNLVVSAGINSVAVLEKAPGAQADESGSSENQAGGRLSIVTGSGKVVKDAPGMNSITWSPGGKYLLATGPSTTTVFDNRLRIVGSININNSSLYTWLDDSTIFYSVDKPSGQLWSYGVATEKSQKITALTPGDSLTGIYPGTDGSYVYFSDNNGEKAQLFKAGLRSQPVDNSLNALSIFLPEDVGVCSLNYINFTKPVVTIRYPSSGTDPALCIKSAKGELQYYSINPNKFSFITTPYTPEY